MKISRNELFWVDNLHGHNSMIIVGAKRGGRRGRRRIVKPEDGKTLAQYDGLKIKEMTPEIWEAYNRGSIRVVDPGSDPNPTENFSATKDELGIVGMNFLRDRKFREAYKRHMILRDEGEAVMISRDDSGELKTGFYLVEPGSEDPDRINLVLAWFSGTDLKVFDEYSRKTGYSRVWMTRNMKDEIETNHDFVITEEVEEEDAAVEQRYYRVAPGNNGRTELIMSLRRWDGDKLEVVEKYSANNGYAVIRTSKVISRFIKRKGYAVEKHDHP